MDQASKSKMANIKQMAMKIVQEEREAAQWAAKREQEMAAAAAAALKRAEEEARIRLQEERELARLRAERALAELKAREEQEALAAAVQAEVERLRNRTPLEVLQEEMAELRQEFDSYKKAHPATLVVPLKQDGTPDMRHKTSRQFVMSGPWIGKNQDGSIYKKAWACDFVDSKGNIVFHFNPRFTEDPRFHNDYVVMNSKLGEHWGSEEHKPASFFGLRDNTKITFTLTKDAFHIVSSNGNNYTFTLRSKVEVEEIRLGDWCAICKEL